MDISRGIMGVYESGNEDFRKSLGKL